MKKLIFFDLDQTLVKVNSSFRFGLFLYRQRKLPFFIMLKLIGSYLRYQCGRITLNDLHHYTFQTYFLGQMAAPIVFEASTFWDCYYDSLVAPAMIEKVLEAKAQGHIPIILSSSPDFLVREFARRIGVTRCHGTLYKSDLDGKFSSIDYVVDGPKKAALATSLAEEYKVPLDQTVGYSDSMEDREFLDTVGSAFLVDNRRQQNHVRYI